MKDSCGGAQVCYVTGNKILRILKSNILTPDLPEDFYHMIKKEISVHSFLRETMKSKDAKYSWTHFYNPAEAILCNRK